MPKLATAIVGLALAVAAPMGPAAAQQRELGAHEHGRGTLNIAFEGTRLTMELEVPGVDIVGFEHPAKSRKDKAAVESATQRLSTPLALFKLPATAGCAVKEASAEFEGDHDHDHGKETAAKGSKGKEGTNKTTEKDGHDHEHAQFHAQYTLVCKSPAKVTAIDFEYFRAFAGAQKLEVNVITAKGQSKFEVTRAKPRLDLSGMM